MAISKSGLSIYLINDNPIQEIYVMVSKTRRIKKSYENSKLVLPPAHAQPSTPVWWFTDHTPPHLQALDDSQHHLPLPLLGSFNSSYPTISNTFPRLIPLVKEVIAYLYNSTYNKCLCITSLLLVFCNIVTDKYSKCIAYYYLTGITRIIVYRIAGACWGAKA